MLVFAEVGVERPRGGLGGDRSLTFITQWAYDCRFCLYFHVVRRYSLFNISCLLLFSFFRLKLVTDLAFWTMFLVRYGGIPIAITKESDKSSCARPWRWGLSKFFRWGRTSSSSFIVVAHIRLPSCPYAWTFASPHRPLYCCCPSQTFK